MLSSPLPVTRALCHCGIWKRSPLPWLLPQDVSRWPPDDTRQPAGVGARPRGHMRGIHTWQAALCSRLAHSRGPGDLGQGRGPLPHLKPVPMPPAAELGPVGLEYSLTSQVGLTFPPPASPRGGRNVRREAGLPGPAASPLCTWLRSSGDFLGPPRPEHLTPHSLRLGSAPLGPVGSVAARSRPRRDGGVRIAHCPVPCSFPSCARDMLLTWINKTKKILRKNKKQV